MIEISEKITVKADINKVWAFLTEFSGSLSFNRFHIEMELPPKYSLAKMEKFTIVHNFGFGSHEMEVKVLEFVPPNRLVLSEECADDPNKGFPHTSTFNIAPWENDCIIHYDVKGTFGGKVQDIPFSPILKGVIIEELLKMKKAIESSEVTPQGLQAKSVKTI